MKYSNIDVLHDPIRKLAVKICLPIILVSVIRIFTTTLMNDVYRAYCPDVFAVLGLLNICFAIPYSVTEGIVIGAWTESAASYIKNPENSNQKMFNSVCAGLLMQSTAVLLFAIFADAILQFLNVPQIVLPQAREYYFVFLFSSLLYVVGKTFVQLTTGLGTSVQIFIVNTLDSVAPLLVGWLFLGTMNLGMGGAAAREGVSCLLLAIVSFMILRKSKVIRKFQRKDWIIDVKLIARMLKRGIFLIAQSMLCSIGYFLVTYQTNKYLDLNYISVLSVSLPITSVFVAFSTLCTVVIPQNYALGNAKRTKAIFRVIVACCFIYGLIVFLAHALLGTWYYGRLFDDENVVRMGAEYWFWYGLGLFACSFLYSFRFFFVAISENFIAMLTGIFELLGNLLAAFWLIPAFGNVGCSTARLLGWGFAAIYLVVTYLVMRKKIYANCGKMKNE